MVQWNIAVAIPVNVSSCYCTCGLVISLHQHYNTYSAWFIDIRIYQLVSSNQKLLKNSECKMNANQLNLSTRVFLHAFHLLLLFYWNVLLEIFCSYYNITNLQNPKPWMILDYYMSLWIICMWQSYSSDFVVMLFSLLIEHLVFK